MKIIVFVVEMKKVYYLASFAQYDNLKNALLRSGFHFYADIYHGEKVKYERH